MSWLQLLVAFGAWLALSVLVAKCIDYGMNGRSHLSHADPGAPPPGSAFDAVEFVYPPWVPYDGKRRLP